MTKIFLNNPQEFLSALKEYFAEDFLNCIEYGEEDGKTYVQVNHPDFHDFPTYAILEFKAKVISFSNIAFGWSLRDKE
jgi:hypothetical protein